MTTYKMTPELAQIITEDLLDECWHSSSLTIHNDTSGQCKKCGIMLYAIGGANRTFTTNDDQKLVMRKLVEKGLWYKFCQFTWKEFAKADTSLGSESAYKKWFFLEEERFCVLAGQFMKERRKKE